MINETEIRSRAEKGEFDGFLPITARPLMIRAYLLLIEKFTETDFPTKILSYLREGADTSELQSMLEQEMFWPFKIAKDLGLSDSKLDQLKDTMNPVMSDDFLGDNTVNKDFINSITKNLKSVFAEGLPIVEEKSAELPMAAILLSEIIGLKIKERSLLSASPRPSYEIIATELAPIVDSIVETFLVVKSLSSRMKVLEKRMIRTIESSEGGKARWAHKHAVFQDFVTWALEFESPELFKFPKHAAEHYLRSVLPGRPLPPDQIRSVNNGSVRKMCEELQAHCRSAGIPNPFVKGG